MPSHFYCEKCDFKCSKQSIYNKHLATVKHKIHGYIHPSTTDIKDTIQMVNSFQQNKEYKCPFCLNLYKYHSGLWRHKLVCSQRNHQSKNNIDILADGIPDPYIVNQTSQNIVIHKTPLSNINGNGNGNGNGNSNDLLEHQITLKDLAAENREMKQKMNIMLQMIATNSQFQSQILELMKTSYPQITNDNLSQSHPATVASNIESNGDYNTFNNTTTTNSNNNTFNMNMFLNEKCKDAMNMKDFVDSIQLNMTDLENVGRLGYVEGMSNILIDNLQKTDLYKRPVHCSDVKRETLYVKENNQWERDGPDHAKMTNAVLAVEHKNVVLVNEWAKANPRCLNSHTRENDKYIRLSKIVTDGEKDGNIDKVIRKVAKQVTIEKDQKQITYS